MGWKTNTLAGMALVAVAAGVLLPRVPGHYLASDAEVKSVVRALHAATADLRRTIGVELLAVKRIEPETSERRHPTYGAYQVRVNESGTIVARSMKYDVTLVFVPLAGGKTVPWGCRVSPAEFVIEGCEPGGE